MPDTGHPGWVVVGRVVKAHGIRGEVVVHPLSDVPGRFDPGTEVVVGSQRRTIVASRPHQGRLLLGFDRIHDRSEAERLRGRDVLAAPVDVSDSDAFYAHELVGLAVVHVDGRHLGVVTALIELPEAAGYDLLEVERDGETWLLPCADDLVEAVEDEDGTLRLVVDPPEGLVDGEPEVVRSDVPAPEAVRPDHLDATAGTSDPATGGSAGAVDPAPDGDR